MTPKAPSQPPGLHPHEPHRGLAAGLNRLRAGVLGAQDGIVSTAGLVVGVAGADTGRPAVLLAGVAGLVAGALSMAGGEYVSVSAQRDTEVAALAREVWELRQMPDEELAELTAMLQAKGLGPDLARQAAVALTEHDALGAHAEIELGIDAQERTSPWQAAWASLLAFTLGALLPLLSIALPPLELRVPLTVVTVTLALAGTGLLSSRLGGAPWQRPVARNVLVGWLTMAVTFGIGSLVGAAV